MKSHSPINKRALAVPADKKIKQIKERMEEILQIAGLDIKDPTLSGTAEKYAEFFVNDMFSALDPHSFPQISFEQTDFAKDEMVILKNITLISWCEHHLVPMSGVAHIAYIPKKRIIGLSKINEIVRYFARRPQLQERLNAQIADSLAEILATEDVAVVTHLKHYCIAARGVEDSETRSEMHVVRGAFEKDAKKHFEFFSTISGKSLGGE